MKTLLRLLNYIGCVALYIVVIKFLKWLLKQDNISIYTELFVYFGIGVLLYYPFHYILKHTEK